jgi:hypothetical protein
MIGKLDIKSHIIANYNQIQLYAKYLDIDVEEIEYCLLDKNNKISNPLRIDGHPSLGFMFYDNGKLIAKDWGNSFYTGDIFYIIGLLSDNDCNDTRDFITICDIILNNNSIDGAIKSNQINILNKQTSLIKYTDRRFNKVDLTFWETGGITVKHLYIRHVFAAKYVWIDNMDIPVYIFNNINNPSYIYYLGCNNNNKSTIKVYSPLGDKKNKFRTNNNNILEASCELYKADTLIITKSRKDKLAIECNLYDNNYNCYVSDLISKQLTATSFKSIGSDSIKLPTYCVTSFNSESNRLKSDVVDGLKEIYNNIIINTDYDKQGILNGFHHNTLFNIKTVFLGRKLDKDLFTNKEKVAIIRKIQHINSDITLFSSMIDNYIDIHSSNYKDKDIFDYITSNGIDKGRILINKLFKKG